MIYSGQNCGEYVYSESMSATTSCATSIASSDLSDDGYVDIEDDMLNPFLDEMVRVLFFSPCTV